MQPHLAAKAPFSVIPGFPRFFYPPVGRSPTLLLRLAELVHEAHMFPFF